MAVIENSPMTPPERDATDAYEAHLDEVQNTPITEPGDASLRAAVVEFFLAKDDCRDGGGLAARRSRGRFYIAEDDLRVLIQDSLPGIEFVDPSVVERVKGMPPLDKGEDQ